MGVGIFALLAILNTSNSLTLRSLEQETERRTAVNNSLSIDVANKQTSVLTTEHLLEFGFVDVGSLEYANNIRSAVALR